MQRVDGWWHVNRLHRSWLLLHWHRLLHHRLLLLKRHRLLHHRLMLLRRQMLLRNGRQSRLLAIWRHHSVVCSILSVHLSDIIGQVSRMALVHSCLDWLHSHRRRHLGLGLHLLLDWSALVDRWSIKRIRYLITFLGHCMFILPFLSIIT